MWDGYEHLKNGEGKNNPFTMDDTQNKNYKLHHKAMKFLVTFISFKEYKKISNIESTKTIYDSLRFNYEGNKQVKNPPQII